MTLIDVARLELELESVLQVPLGVHTPGEFGPSAVTRIALRTIRSQHELPKD